jgi:acyl-CoA reductase-like NAD-dependent aldehyde dehydrogenase
LSILRFKTTEEAIEIANNTFNGLSSSVWTKDIDRAMTISRSLESGTVWINILIDGYAIVSFGGYKESGQGG